MGVDIALQAAAFVRGVSVGAALGLLYDVMRVIRRLGGRGVAQALDLLFWLWATLCLFLCALLLGDGEVRIYLMGAFALGGGGYLLLLSPVVLPILSRLAAAL